MIRKDEDGVADSTIQALIEECICPDEARRLSSYSRGPVVLVSHSFSPFVQPIPGEPYEGKRMGDPFDHQIPRGVILRQCRLTLAIHFQCNGLQIMPSGSPPHLNESITTKALDVGMPSVFL